MDPEDKDYVCSLDAATLKKAKEELHENSDDRLAAVKALRDWIKQQPHITCGTLDTEALLVILRGAKFSQVRSRELLEGNLLLKTVAPDWFLNVDTTEPKLSELLKAGYVVPLPKRTKDGCGIILYRLAQMKPNQNHLEIMMKAGMIISVYMNKCEAIQIHGNIFIFDFTGVTSNHMSGFMNRKHLGRFHKLWQKNVPGRFKGFYYYNAGVFFEALMTVARPFLPKKYQDRIKVHDTAESLYKDIPLEVLPEEYLPDDYTGPNAGPIKHIIEHFVDVISKDDFRNDIKDKSSDAYSVDLSKKPAETVTDHFRKLSVD